VAVKRRAQAAPTGVVGKKDGGHLRGSSSRKKAGGTYGGRRHKDKTRQDKQSGVTRCMRANRAGLQ